MENIFSRPLIREIAALNQGFIDLLITAADSDCIPMDMRLRERLNRMLQQPQDTLRRCPFLLFRLCFDDVALTPDVLALRASQTGVTPLATITLSFLWQLARRDVAGCELVSGADGDWCQQLARTAMADLVDIAATANLRARLTDVPGYWQDLSRPDAISALQKASLGAAGWQIIMSTSRRRRLPRSLPDIPAHSTHRAHTVHER